MNGFGVAAFKRISVGWAAAGCVVAALFGSGNAAAHDGVGASLVWPGGNHYQRSIRSYAVPDVQLIDADGHPVRLRELLDAQQPTMLNFIFTTCSTICPVMVKVFADVPSRLNDAAKRDLLMISISIDPENDTPARLKTYSERFGAGRNWRFLTGRLDDITVVLRAFDSYRGGDKMAHEPLTLMRHAKSKSWLRIDGFANPDELAAEYQRPMQSPSE